MVEAKTQLLWSETKTKQKKLVEIEAYLKPSWVLASTNIFAKRLPAHFMTETWRFVHYEEFVLETE
jgi:hypothetical protein